MFYAAIKVKYPRLQDLTALQPVRPPQQAGSKRQSWGEAVLSAETCDAGVANALPHEVATVTGRRLPLANGLDDVRARLYGLESSAARTLPATTSPKGWRIEAREVALALPHGANAEGKGRESEPLPSGELT
ncbi:hypothetical protein CYMTET_16792 [Cymbomonas tetramitiformis]|uniref:Uncharacterized protein n=1 Tax=Cymbomonas tetramitiformis TaxID=36881 RepID=A0AAE0L7X4_9CHLO|nr:hypothetical protein CYMTET_16792 [Cymbomonas tetramitiformis]